MTHSPHHPRTDERSAPTSSGWKVLLVTSIAALLTGFAAWYFVLAEDWGSTLLKGLRGHEDLFGIRIEGLSLIHI